MRFKARAIAAGINSAADELEKGVNDNLRLFSLEGDKYAPSRDSPNRRLALTRRFIRRRIRYQQRRQTLTSTDPDHYQVCLQRGVLSTFFFDRLTLTVCDVTTTESHDLLSRTCQDARRRVNQLAAFPTILSGLARHLPDPGLFRRGDL
jgi:hypothetical protein